MSNNKKSRYNNNQKNKPKNVGNQQNHRYHNIRNSNSQQQNRSNTNQQAFRHCNRTNHQSKNCQACFLLRKAGTYVSRMYRTTSEGQQEEDTKKGPVTQLLNSVVDHQSLFVQLKPFAIVERACKVLVKTTLVKVTKIIKSNTTSYSKAQHSQSHIHSNKKHSVRISPMRSQKVPAYILRLIRSSIILPTGTDFIFFKHRNAMLYFQKGK